MKIFRIPLLLLLVFASGTGGRAWAFDLPEEALVLLAEASSDPCSICAADLTKKAFGILEKSYAPGNVLKTDASCRLARSPSKTSLAFTPTCYPSAAFMGRLEEGDLPPQVEFAFYAPGRKLVGIAEKDLTRKEIADSFEKAGPGALFDGRIEIVSYPYGDREGFNYFKESGRLRVHCRVLELEPVSR